MQKIDECHNTVFGTSGTRLMYTSNEQEWGNRVYWWIYGAEQNKAFLQGNGDCIYLSACPKTLT